MRVHQRLISFDPRGFICSIAFRIYLYILANVTSYWQINDEIYYLGIKNVRKKDYCKYNPPKP
jgi:hypothetical protein